MLILSGDIGATKSKFAFFEIIANTMHIQNEVTFTSAHFSNIQDIIARAIAIANVQPNVIGLGIAGPVRNQRSNTTNLPWHVDSRSLENLFNFAKIHIINDLEAIAWGIPKLNLEDFFELHSGKPDLHGNLAIIAAGTGLGEAGVYRRSNGFYPFSSEGGHADFAPSGDPIELALLQFLTHRYGHVSWERIVSGLGIPKILEFLCQYKNSSPPIALSEKLAHGGNAQLIAAAADAGECPVCEEAMRLFVRMYGREAGNFALKIMATGGVYLAGGIAPKILPRLCTGDFLTAFFDKGRMEPLMRDIPVKIIMHDKVALYGAAIAAMRGIL